MCVCKCTIHTFVCTCLDAIEQCWWLLLTCLPYFCGLGSRPGLWFTEVCLWESTCLCLPAWQLQGFPTKPVIFMWVFHGQCLSKHFTDNSTFPNLEFLYIRSCHLYIKIWVAVIFQNIMLFIFFLTNLECYNRFLICSSSLIMLNDNKFFF